MTTTCPLLHSGMMISPLVLRKASKTMTLIRLAAKTALRRWHPSHPQRAMRRPRLRHRPRQ